MAGLQQILRENTCRTSPLHDGQDDCLWVWIQHWKLQFFGCWFWDILTVFSARKVPSREFELIEAFRDPTPVDQWTQIRSVLCEVLWHGIRSAQRRGTWHDHTRNAEQVTRPTAKQRCSTLTVAMHKTRVQTRVQRVESVSSSVLQCHPSPALK